MQEERPEPGTAGCPAVVSVDLRRWPRVRVVHRSSLRPPRPRLHLRLALAAGALGLLIACGLALAYQRTGELTEQVLAASYRGTGLRLLAGGHPQHALPYFVAARQHGDESPALKALFGAAARAEVPEPPRMPLHVSFDPEDFELEGDDSTSTNPGSAGISINVSPDGHHVLIAGEDGAVQIWDLAPDERSLAEWQTVLARSPFPTIRAAIDAARAEARLATQRP